MLDNDAEKIYKDISNYKKNVHFKRDLEKNADVYNALKQLIDIKDEENARAFLLEYADFDTCGLKKLRLLNSKLQTNLNNILDSTDNQKRTDIYLLLDRRIRNAIEYYQSLTAQGVSKLKKINTVRPYAALLNAKNNQEIFEILTKYGNYEKYGIQRGNEKVSDLKFCDIYLRAMYGDDYDYSKEKAYILKCIDDVVSHYRRINAEKSTEKKKEKENQKQEELRAILPEASTIIKEFMCSSMRKYDFLKEKGITESEFKNVLKAVELFDNELYNSYNNYIEAKQAQSFIALLGSAKKIIYLIKNGIPDENGETRPFELLDYYSFISLDISKFLEIVKRTGNTNDYRTVIQFLGKYKSLPGNQHKAIYDMNISINGRTVTTEEKKLVIDYLKSINAPINTTLFHQAIRRYYDNKLILTDNQENSEKAR